MKKTDIQKSIDFLKKAISFDKKQKLLKAIDLYSKAIDLNPDLEQAFYIKALCLHDLCHYNEAVKIVPSCFDVIVESYLRDHRRPSYWTCGHITVYTPGPDLIKLLP